MAAASLAGLARTDETKDPKKPASKDSTATADDGLASKGFKNLFKSDSYNPAEPYTAQIHPMAAQYINDYMTRQGKMLNNMKVWAQPYFRMMDGILEGYGIPKELKYLAVIESQLQPWAYSWAGAVGPWQFMEATAKRMGLVVSPRLDERTNYIRSTQAAAKYLRELYGQLGDWLLVIAAYNGGPGRVFSAMKKSGTKDFWKLQQYLPQESRNHVKKFIGTHYIMEGAGGVTTTTAEDWSRMQSQTLAQTALLQSELDNETLAKTETYNIEGKYNSLVIANQLVIDIAEFNRLNPNFDRLVAAEGGYDLRLPQEKMETFKVNQFIYLRLSLMAALEGSNKIGAGYPTAKPRPATAKKGK